MARKKKVEYAGTARTFTSIQEFDSRSGSESRGLSPQSSHRSKDAAIQDFSLQPREPAFQLGSARRSKWA